MEDLQKKLISLGEILDEKEQQEAKEMAVMIGGMLGNSNRSVMQHALTLSLASAELIDFCPPATRDSLIDFFVITIRATLKAFEENKINQAKHAVKH